MTRTFGGSQLWRALHGSTALVVSLAGLAAVSHPFIARADTNVLPQGGTVVVGAATIRSTTPGSLDVTTATQHTAIDWQSFSIGANNRVDINQPNASALTLNQVVGSDPSQIFGILHSNGQVVLANPNGIWFGPGSHVDVASIVASTATASTAALNAFARGGALMLDQAGRADASIVNDGSISLGAEGLGALVAPGVANNGIIRAQLGRVVLASGTVATLDFYGDGLISFAVGGSVTAAAKDQAGKALSAAVVNSGTISNAGGTVLLTAAAAKTVVDNTINMSGVVVASAVSTKGGEIDLDGGSGTINVSGELLASSQTATGGTINATGHSVVVAPTARLDVTGATGGSVAIGGGLHGGGSLAHATSVTLASGSTITADATAGRGGTVAVWSDGDTVAAGTITATGPAGGGMVETSGETLKIDGIAVKAGSWLLDPISVELTSSDQATISTALNNGTSVSIATSAGSAPTGGFGTSLVSDTAGDILVDADATGIAWSTTASLTLNAYGAVIVASGAKIQDSAAGFIGLYSRGGVSIASGATVSNVGSQIYTSGSGQSVYAGTVSGGFVSLSDTGAITIAGTGVISGTSNGLYIETGSLTVQSGAALSNVGVMELITNSALTVQSGATLSTTSGYINAFGTGAIDLGGTLHASYVQFYSPSIQIDSTASISTTSGAYFSATNAFSVATAASALLVAPSLEIVYGGGSVGLGTTISGTGALNLAPGNLTALGFGAGTGTTQFTILDNAVGASITTGGSLTFPGAVQLSTQGGAVNLGGTISLAGAGNFSDTNTGGTINVTGSIIDSASADLRFSANNSITIGAGAVISDPHGTVSLYNSYASGSTSVLGQLTGQNVYLYDPNTLTLGGSAVVSATSGWVQMNGNATMTVAAGASVTAATSIYDYYYYAPSSALDLAGSLHASVISLYGSSIQLDSTSSISAAVAYFSASSAFVLPSLASAVLTAANLEIDYAGGPIGLGATVSGANPLNLDSGTFTALGFGAGTGTSRFAVYDTRSGSSITTAGSLTFPGSVSLSTQAGAIDLGGTISINGTGSFSDSYSGGTINISGTITDSGAGSLGFNAVGAISLASGASISDAGGTVSLTDNSSSGLTSIGGTISGQNVYIQDSGSISLASTAAVTATTGSVQLTSSLNTTVAAGATVTAAASIYDYYYYSSNAAIDLAGSLHASVLSFYGNAITIEQTASLSAPTAYFSASGSYTFPTAGTAVLTAPNLEFDYLGGAFGLGTTVTGGQAAIITSGGLTALGIGTTSGTTRLTIYDGNQAAGDIDVGSGLNLPGSLTLISSYGNLSVNGAVSFVGNGSLSGALSTTILGSISDTGTSGTLAIGGLTSLGSGYSITNSGGSVYISANSNTAVGAYAGTISAAGTISIGDNYGISLAPTAVMTAQSGVSLGSTGAVTIAAGAQVSAGSGTAWAGSTGSAAAIDVAGTVTGSYAQFYGSSIQLDSTASITANSVVLSASSALALPSGSGVNVTAPSLEIDYGGGPIGINTTVTGTGALSLTAPVLAALGVQLSGGTSVSGTSLLRISDTLAGANVTLAGPITFAGPVSIGANLGVITIGGGLTLTKGGFFGLYSQYYYTADTTLIAVTGSITNTTSGTISMYGSLNLAPGASINNSVGAVSLVDGGYATGTSSIGGSISGTSVVLQSYGGLTIASGAVINGGTGSANLSAYGRLLDIAGIVTANSFSANAGTIEIDGTASITAASASLSASSAYVLPTSGPALLIAPSLELDYAGGPIGIETTVSGTGALTLTAAELAALGVSLNGGTSVTGTSRISVYDTGGSISLPGGLVFPGSVSLYSSSGSIVIGGDISFTGAGGFYATSGGVSLAGSMTDTGTGASAGGISISGLLGLGAGQSITNAGGSVNLYSTSSGGAMSIAGSVSGSSIYISDYNGLVLTASGHLASSGYVSINNYYYNPTTAEIAGTISGSAIAIYASTIQIDSTASITASNQLSLSASTAYVLPSGGQVNVTAPSLVLAYGGGPIGIETTASGTGALNLTAGILADLGISLSGGTSVSGTALFQISDYATSGDISLAAGLVFPGGLSLYSSNGVISVPGALSFSGYGSIYGYRGVSLSGSISDLATGASASSVYITGLASLAAGLSITNAGGVVSVQSGYYNSLAMVIDGTISGTGVSLSDSYGVTVAADGALHATAGTVSVAGSSGYTDIVTINGAISGSQISVYGSSLSIGGSASLVATSGVSLSASSAYALPSGATQVITAPSVTVAYSGGNIGIGAATATGAGALNLNNATLAAIGATTASSRFTVAQTNSSYGIAIGGPLTFAGNLELDGYYYGSTPFTVSGSITALGVSMASYYYYYYNNTVTLAGDTTITAGAGGINIGGSINGAYHLSLLTTASSPLVLSGAIGNTTALTGLTMVGNDSSYLPSINVAGNVSITNGYTIYLSSTTPLVATGGGAVSLIGDTLGNSATGLYVSGTGAPVSTTGAVTIQYHPTSYGTPLTKAGFAPNASSFSLTYLVDNGYDLTGISANATALAQHYLLQNNISLSGIYSSALIGSSSTPFTGTFDGGGHTISNLNISYTSGYFIGLFGEIGSAGVVTNLGITNANVLGNVYVGAFAGANFGTITNSYVTGTVSASVNASYMVGGFVGDNEGIISGAYSTANVNGPTGSYKIGGFAGLNNGGTITNSHASGIVTVQSGAIALGGFVGNTGNGLISSSYSDGSVVAPGDGSVGGFAGENFGTTLSNVFSTASVATGGGGTIGGLVGNNAGSIIDSYAAGNISISAGASGVGGLTGASSVTATNSYWDTDTTGVISADASGATGMKTSDLTSGTLPSGFSSANWVATSGSLPYLVWQSGPVATPIAAGSEIVSGTVYGGYLGSGVSGAGVNIIVDGVAVGSTTSSNGGTFSVQFASTRIPSAAGNHEIIGYLTGGLNGLTAYDTVALPYAGLPIYENEVVLQTTSSNLSSAVTALASALTNAGASVANTLTISNGAIATTANLGMIISASAPSFTIDDSINTGSGRLLLSTSGTYVQQSAAITTGSLLVNGTAGVFTLLNLANSIASVATGPLTAGVTTLEVADSGTLEVDSVTATTNADFVAPSLTFGAGATVMTPGLYLQTDALSMLSGAAIASGTFVSVDTFATGGSIGLGTASGTLQLTQSQIDFLDVGSTFFVGDTSGSISTAGTVNLPGQPYLIGNSVTLGGTVTAGYGLTVTGSTITVDGTVTGGTSYGLIFDVASGGSFTENAGASIASSYISVNPQNTSGMTINIDGTLTTSSSLTLETGTGGSLTLGSGAAVSAGYNLSLYTDNFIVPTPSGVSLTAGTVYLDTGSGGNPSNIFIGTVTGSGLNLDAATLGVFGNTTPVYIGNANYTVMSVQGYTPGANIHLRAANEIVSGTVYSALGGSTLSGVTVDLVVDGGTSEGSATTDSSGFYSFSFAPVLNGSSHDFAAFVTTTGDEGVALFHGAPFSLSGFNIYAHTVTIETTAATLSSTLSALASELSALPTADQLLTNANGVVATPTGTSLIVTGTGSALDVDESVATGGSQSYTASTLSFGTSNSLAAAAGSIAFKADVLTLPKTISDTTGVSVDTVTAGATIGLGTAPGTISLNQADLDTLGPNLTVGDSASLIVVSGGTAQVPITVAQSLTLIGASINVSGFLTVSGTGAMFTAIGTAGGSSFTLQAAGEITADGINIDPQTIDIAGTLNANASSISLTTLPGGSITIGTGASVSSQSAVTVSTGTNGSLVLDSGSTLSSGGSLSISADNLSVAGTGAAPTITATSVTLTPGDPNADVVVGSTSSPGSVAFPSSVLSLFGSIPVTISASTVRVAPGFTLPGNFVLHSTNNITYTVSGYAYAQYGSTSTLGNAAVTLVVDGDSPFLLTTDSTGFYSKVVTAGQVRSGSDHGVVVLLTGATKGAALYDLNATSFGGLNVYGGAVYLSTPRTSLAAAITNLTTSDSAQLSGSGLTAALLANFTTSSVTAANGFGLIVNGAGAGTTLAVDAAIASGTSTLTLSGIGTVDVSGEALTANTLLLDGSGNFVVTNAGNQIGNVAEASATSVLGNVELRDAAALGIGNLDVSGSLRLDADSMTAASGAVIIAGGGVTLDTLALGGSIGLGGVTSSSLTVSQALLSSVGASSLVVIGDGANTITAAGTISAPNGIVLNGALGLNGDTSISSGGEIVFEGVVTPAQTGINLTLDAVGDIYFAQSVGSATMRLQELTVTHAKNFTAAHVAGALDTGAGGPSITQTTSTDPFTRQLSTVNAQLFVHGFNTGGSATYDDTGRLISVNAGVTGTLSVGLFSLESDGDVAIFATAVDGRIVAGNNGSSGAGAATAGTITVAAVDVTNSSFEATRSANVGAVDTISNTNVSANVATITATNISNTNVQAVTVTANADNYSHVNIASDNPPTFNGGDPSVGHNTYNGGAVTPAVVQLAALNVPTNASNPKVSKGSGQSVSSGDDEDDSSGDSGDKKKKGEKGGKNGAEKAGDKAKKPAKTYDAANQFLNKLLSAKKPATPPI